MKFRITQKMFSLFVAALPFIIYNTTSKKVLYSICETLVNSLIPKHSNKNSAHWPRIPTVSQLKV